MWTFMIDVRAYFYSTPKLFARLQFAQFKTKTNQIVLRWKHKLWETKLTNKQTNVVGDVLRFDHEVVGRLTFQLAMFAGNSDIQNFAQGNFLEENFIHNS